MCRGALVAPLFLFRMAINDVSGYKLPGVKYLKKMDIGLNDGIDYTVNNLDWQNAVMFFALPWTQTEENSYTPQVVKAYGINHLAYSEYTPKHPVTSWGSSSIKGITSGPRSVAGNLVLAAPILPFTNELVKSYVSTVYKTDLTVPGSLKTYNFSVTDLPPMDATVVVPEASNFSNKYYSLVFKGFTFVDSNWVLFSIQNPISTQALTFICHGVTLLD